MAEPRRDVAFDFYIALVSTATSDFLDPPTVVVGDFKVSTDGSAYVNLATLPVVDPATSATVKVSLSAAEMGGDSVNVLGIDLDDVWQDVLATLDLGVATIDTVHNGLYNDSTVVDVGGGVREITVFDDGGVGGGVIIAKVSIAADGLSRLKLSPTP